jgi:uncharacterized protein (DUF1330 family)
MACYFMAQIRITDRDEYDRYLAGTDAVFAKYEGEYLAVDTAPTVLEGEWAYDRAVLIRFPDAAALRRWYESPEYQEILRHRLAGAKCLTLAVAGLPGLYG